MHLWLRLGIIQVNLASALALHKRSKKTPPANFSRVGAVRPPGTFTELSCPLSDNV